MVNKPKKMSNKVRETKKGRESGEKKQKKTGTIEILKALRGVDTQ